MPDAADLAFVNRWQRGFPLDARPFAKMGISEDKALSTLDENVRMDAFKQLQRVLVDKAHWAYLYQQMDIYGFRNRLQFEPTADEWMHLEKAQVNK